MMSHLPFGHLVGYWFLSILRIITSDPKGPRMLQKCSRNGNLRATCLTHHRLTVSACIFACQSSDTWDVRDILDIDDSGSLSKLDLSKNNLMSEGLSAVSEALKSTPIKHLNIAENNLTKNQQYDNDMSGVIKFADDMKDMGPLSSLILKGNQFANREAGAALGSMLKTCASLTALDVSENYYFDVSLQCDGPGFASEIASGLRAAKGSLSSANLLGNDIGVEQAQALLKVKEAKPGLTTLCGLSGDETELDLSGKNLRPGCAILLAPEMEANGSLSELDLSKNNLRSEGLSAVSEALKATSIKQLNIAGNDLTSTRKIKRTCQGSSNSPRT